MRIGVFGGTFDPVHLGHLIVAEQCREQARLDQVWFIPAARPPHKEDVPLTAFVHRAEMLALATAGHSAYRVDRMEEARPGPSYTAETLEEIRRRQPADELFLLLGSDCLPDLPHWHEPSRIFMLAELLVVARPGWPIWPPEQVQAAVGVGAGIVRQQVIHGPLVDISSRDLRRRVVQGRSVRYLVPRAVECYIETHGLYQPQGSQGGSSSR